MKSRLLMAPIVMAAFVFGLLMVNAQQSDDEVRGVFLSSRPKTMNQNAPARRRQRPPRNTNTSAVKNTNQQSANNSSGSINANRKFTNSNSAAPQLAAIGLGYTLFMRDENGRAVRIEPGREFHNGDRIRISLEPNIDGYLYVFHTENDGPPEMIFPDARLEGGENWIDAHVPVEVPSTVETDERLRWFQFYGNAATERLYIVVTREPLPGVPTGDALVSYCNANKDKCPWRPATAMWMQIQQDAKANVKVVSNKVSGEVQTPAEQNATTRGLGLDQTAPQPSVIRLNATTTAPVLVTVLDLVHK